MQEQSGEEDNDEQQDVEALLEHAKIAREDQGGYEMEVSFGREEATLLHEMTKCMKNPGHKGFIPAKDFTIDHLPRATEKHPFIFGSLKHLALMTVRLAVSYTSFARPVGYPFYRFQGHRLKRLGTGMATVVTSDEPETLPCTDPNCQLDKEKEPHHEFGCFLINTATHVVFDESEAQNTVVEFFYDSEDDKSGVVTARGIHAEAVVMKADRTLIKCVTHDSDLIDRLVASTKQYAQLCKKFEVEQFTNKKLEDVAVVTSHPHGKCKQISFGTYGQGFPFDSHHPENACYSAPTCRGSSGAPVLKFVLRPDRCLPKSLLFYGHSGHGAQGLNQASKGKPSWLL